MVVYSYDINRFHVPASKTWNKDSDTKCQITYTIDDRGNTIQESRLHIEDGSQKPVITDYQYDGFGNMIRKTVNSPDNIYTTYYEYGVDKDGTDHKGAYLTREYSILNGAEISKHYVYDFLTGDVKAEIDQRGNRTSHEYDIFHRPVKTENPDGGTILYKYIDLWNQDRKREITDPNGTVSSYSYDTTGNLLEYSVFDKDQWHVVNKYEYDSDGNKIKEIDANGNSIRYEYNSTDLLTKKSYWEKDKTEKECIWLKYETGTGPDTFRLVTVTDEEGYKSKMHYDVMNRLITVEVTPDNKAFYTNRSSYDFEGNEVSWTDSRNNTTEFIYDDLNRLVKQIDALKNETVYKYNNMGNPVRKEEPENKITEYIYDLLGRLVTEKVYKKNDSNYAYKSYTYDNSGNIISIKAGTVSNGVDNLASEIKYAYDAMNRVTDEYKRLDDSRESHTNFKYDKNGNKLQQTDYIDSSGARFIRASYAYDYAGRVISEEGFMQEQADIRRGNYAYGYSYDMAGNLLEKRILNDDKHYVTNYSYDNRNRLTKKLEPYKEDGNRKTTTYTYDKRGLMIGETLNVQGIACTKTYEYDGMGNLIRQTDEMGNTSRFVYDGEKNRIREIDPRYYTAAAEKANPNIINTAPCIETEYDASNRPVRTIAKNGGTSFIISYREHDGRGNVIKEVHGEGYNSSDPSASIGDKYEYDALDRVSLYISAETARYNEENGENKHTKKYTYDGAGNMLTEEDAYGNVTRYSYYLNGLLKEKIYADGIKEAYGYDLTGKAEITFTDRAGNVSKKYMNVFGSPYKLEYPDGTSETFEYNNLGKIIKGVDKMGNSKHFEYDPAQNLITSKEYLNSDNRYSSYRAIRNTYDEAGNILSRETFVSKEPIKEGLAPINETSGDKTTYTYDKASRLIKTTGPNGRETVNKYDARGNLSLMETKTAEGKYDVKRFIYDELSRLVQEITLVESASIDPSYLAKAKFDPDYSGKVWSAIRYDYYNNGLLKSKTDPMGNATRFVYDFDKKLKQKIDALENKTTYVYDLRGNLIEEKDGRNISTKYEYDPLNRLIMKHTPAAGGGTATSRYIYDVSGNLVKQVNPNEYSTAKDTEELAGTMKGMSYDYDNMNRLTAVYDSDGAGIRYMKYDSSGRLIKEVDGLRYEGDIDASLGSVYEYDSFGRLVRKTDGLGNAITIEYDILDNIIKSTDARNNATVFEYNPDRTLAKAVFADGGIILYEYDKQGRMTKQTDQRGSVTLFEYNALGRQTKILDAYNNTQEFKYDLSGNLVTYKDQGGSITKLKYDGNNRLSEKRTPIEEIGSGNYHYYIEKYIYDEIGNIISYIATGTKEPLSKRIINYEYYPNRLLKETVQSSGSNVKYHYDKNGNLIETESLRENGIYDIAKYEYDNQNRMTRSIQLIDEEILAAGEIANISDLRDSEHPDRISVITGYEYDLLGNRIKTINPKAYGYPDSDLGSREEYTITYSYDLLNRLEKINRKHNGSDVYVQYFYDETGNKVKEINEKGAETTFGYDSMNRLITMTDALNNTYEYGYDLAGNKISEKNPNGHTMSYSYDKLNRIEEVIDPYGKVINRKAYDAKGNVIKETDGKGYSTLYEYDLAGRLIKTTDPEGGTTKYEYSQYGELAKHTDGVGNATQYEYDNAGRLIKVTDPMNISTKYTYDKAGNKLTMTDGRGKITRYEYGSFGLLTAYIDADNQAISYKYDLSLMTASMKDRNGNKTIYAYDNKGLLTERKAADTGETITYTYDEAGNRQTMTDGTGTSTYSCNENNWLETIEKDGELQISYAYDPIGNIASVTDKLGNTTQYTYDKSSRMETVSFDGRTIIYEYDENGNRSSINYDGSIEETYTYDKNNRLLELINKKTFGTILSKYSYTYDKAGKQTSKTDSYGTTSYTYDKAGRIQKVEAPGKTTIYAYDNAGNRISQDETYTSEQTIPAIDGTGISEIKYKIKRSEYIYGNTNKLLKLSEKMKDASGTELLEKITTFRYDNNGNEIRRNIEYLSLYNKANPKAYEAAIYNENTTEPIHAAVEQTINKYDGFNRLTRTETIRTTIQTIVQYAYNGDDLRIEKTTRRSDKANEAETTAYLYDRQHVILETRPNDTIRYARGINYIGRTDKSGTLSYYLYNGHGDVTQTVSEAGEIQNQYDYDIFGNPILTIETYENAIRYAGEFYDQETGLYYLRARYYDPYIGRFINEDSYWGRADDPLGLNLYTYCGNDPINFIDPTGHDRINDIIKEIDKQKDRWWKEANSGRGGAGQKDWNETQRDANKRANELREELARLEKGNKEAEKLKEKKGDDAGTWERYKYEKELKNYTETKKPSSKEKAIVEKRLEELIAAESYGVNAQGVKRKDLQTDFGVSSMDELITLSKDDIRFGDGPGNEKIWEKVGKDVGIAQIENQRHPNIRNQEVLSDAKHNRRIKFTAEQIAFASIIDIHGVRDYLAPQKNRSAAQNEAKEDLRNEVYEILTGMKPKYHKNTITGEWVDISRPKNRSAFGEFITGSIVSDADILLNRHYTRDVDLFRMADAIMTTASATMAVQYFIAQAAPVADYYGTKYNVWKQGLNQGNQGINININLNLFNGQSGDNSAKGIDRITGQISKDKPVVIIGESMGRVNPVAEQLRQEGFDVKTYNPQNFRSSPGNLNRLDLEANRSWIRYWTQEKGATVIDIGIDPSRATRSPFYGVENRSIYQNWKYPNVIKYNP